MRDNLKIALLSAVLTPALALAATAQPQEILEPVSSTLRDLETEGPAEPAQQPGDVYQFEPLVVSEKLRREMAYRTVRLGLSRPLSQKFEDADKIVCRFYNNIRTRTSKHLQCATNRTFHFWAQQSVRHLFRGSALSNASGGLAPYTTYHGPIYKITLASKGKIKAMVNEVTHDETVAESREKLLDYARARAIGFQHSRQGFENQQVVRFTKAYLELRARDASRGFTSISDATAEAIIRDAGIDVETYNAIATAAATDEMLAGAILRAADVIL